MTECDCEWGHLGYHRMLLRSDGKAIYHPTPEQLEGSISVEDLPPAGVTIYDLADGPVIVDT